MVDPSVTKCREESLRPTHLVDCMKTFTKVETISDTADLPYCSKCKEVRPPICFSAALIHTQCSWVELTSAFCLCLIQFQPSTKQLQLWRQPPILIIHLKRFSQDARGRMHKVHSLVRSLHLCSSVVARFGYVVACRLTSRSLVSISSHFSTLRVMC